MYYRWVRTQERHHKLNQQAFSRSIAQSYSVLSIMLRESCSRIIIPAAASERSNNHCTKTYPHGDPLASSPGARHSSSIPQKSNAMTDRRAGRVLQRDTNVEKGCTYHCYKSYHSASDKSKPRQATHRKAPLAQHA